MQEYLSKNDREHTDASGPRSELGRGIYDVIADGVARGLPLNMINTVMNDGLDRAADVVVSKLYEDATQMLVDDQSCTSGFEERLYAQWKPAFDLYKMIYVSCLEVGQEYQHSFSERAVEAPDKAEAMTLLHARSCLIASEVLALLRTGHGAGAMARWRTMHEVAVIASILGDNDEELSKRFLLHRHAERRADALEYQQNCAALGLIPYTDAELTEIDEPYQEVVAKYGKDFAVSWGWARPVLKPDERPTFAALQRVAELEHNRPYVRLSNHTVHSGSSGAAQIYELYGHGSVFLAGPSNADLADAGRCALIALNQTTVAYLLHGCGEINDPQDLLVLKVLGKLADDALSAFKECHEDLEERIKAEAKMLSDGAKQS